MALTRHRQQAGDGEYPSEWDCGSGRQVSGVSAVRSEPADVWLNDGRPARFVWRGRLYTVLSVIERPPEPASPGQPAAERCWRVTASPGKSVPADAYQLCQDPGSGRWLLSRDSR